MTEPMAPERFAEKMRQIAAGGDTEGAHSEADQLMCRVLRSLGYGAGVNVYRDMPKWYA